MEEWKDIGSVSGGRTGRIQAQFRCNQCGQCWVAGLWPDEELNPELWRCLNGCNDMEVDDLLETCGKQGQP